MLVSQSAVDNPWIKTWPRISIDQDRLSSLAFIHIEKESSCEIEIDSVIDSFADFKDRRLGTISNKYLIRFLI